MERYIAIRESLAPQYQSLPDAQIERLVRRQFGDVAPADVENFFNTLKSIGGAVTKALPTVLPVAGTVVGSAFGGPLGGMIGSQLGSFAGGAVGQATAPRSPHGSRPGPRGGQPPAAAQLLGVLNRPEVLQGLLSMLMGGAGRGSVPVGGTPVPVGALANLIGMLANRAAEQEGYRTPEAGEAYPEYLMDPVGGFRGDPADPNQRAEVLLELFRQSVPQSAPGRDEEGYDDTDDLYDEAELAELMNDLD